MWSSERAAKADDDKTQSLESFEGALFAGPTYSFLVSFLFMVGYGLIHYFIHPQTVAATNEGLKLAEGYHLQPLTWFLVLGAFSNGCVALSGTEAISNGIPAFKQPESKNAATTLATRWRGERLPEPGTRPVLLRGCVPWRASGPGDHARWEGRFGPTLGPR